MSKIYRYAAAAIVSVLVSSVSASAATIIYGNQSAFLAAVGSSITDNYSNPGYVRSFGPNPPNFMTDSYMTSVLNQTTYKDTMIPTNNNEVVGPLDGSGNPYYCAGCNGSFDLGFGSTTLTSGGGVFGVSFNYRDGGLPGAPNNPLFDFFVKFGDGSTVDYTVPQSGAPGPSGFAGDFWGITSNLQIADIYFGVNGQPSSSAIFAIDNLTIASVPEPMTLAIFFAGLGGVAMARRKKKTLTA
jgi:hypothetical protein